MSATAFCINLLADKYAFRRYLEIGVRDGATFCNVKMPHKTAVDPNFVFDTGRHASPLISYFSETSDDFFAALPERLEQKPYKNFNLKKDFKFDIIYIDGMHTFEQSYRDFRNALNHIHDNSIIIFDDTLPRDPWSAIPDQEKSMFYRRMANIAGDPWHGDVYRTIYAIHDYHPEFCYATNVTTGFPQTIVWKNPQPVPRKRKFNSMLNINIMSYFDMLDNAYILVPLQLDEILPLIGTNIDVDSYMDKVDYRSIIPPLVSIR